jgi:hypothetical protein
MTLLWLALKSWWNQSRRQLNRTIKNHGHGRPSPEDKKMTNYTKTFYANAVEGCVNCHPDDLPQGGNWIVSDDSDWVMNELAHVSRDSEYFKVTQQVYDAVKETYNIYN